MRYIITLLIILTAAMIEHAYHIRNIHINEQATSAQIKQLQQEAQQRDDALRSEIDRMKQEPSRGGNRRVMTVTAYTANDCGKQPGHPEYGVTAYGKKLTESDAYNVVAADPRYYPAGTRMHLEYVGDVVVVDTGGDIKGPDRLDLFVGMTNIAEANKWGRRNVQVVIER